MNQPNDLRDELTAVMGARKELSPEDERYLVESFLDRLDRQLEARMDARIEQRMATVKRGGRMEAWVVPAALGIAIPITAISAAAAGGIGILIALAFVVSVLAIYAEYSTK